MQSVITVELTRDCEVVQIPLGSTAVLPKGTSVDITQTLGGSYTVHGPGGLYRVASKDVDALGMSAPVGTVPEASTGGEVTEERVWETLRTCFDPEIPVNIVDLGLVYDMQLTKGIDGQRHVEVKMTLTAPGCGMGPSIAGDAQQKLLDLEGVSEANVEIVWDPPWHQSMITPEGRRLLGLE
jgi:probable FeS assembly SUF system protein SufT